MLVAQALQRLFIISNKDKEKEVRLADPFPNLSPEAVMNFYSSTYPELVSSKLEGPVITDDRVEYRFSSTIGTKG